MLHRTLFCLAVIGLLSACSTVWIPVGDNPKRAAVPRAHVQFLESAPQKPHRVIGIITPEPGAYSTEAQAVKAMRREAAKHGADAVFIESMSESGGWKFGTGFGGTLGGSFTELRFRVKAIVWN